ncbi:MAG TPA: hypothetical protein VMX75_01005 [Spirochaetia bacterium]|nr:hypothetical protein [Spirochaetia bacterium]
MRRVLLVGIMSVLAATDPTKHFVKQVTVSVNGKQVLVQYLDSQESPTTEVAIYKLSLKSGDKVSVDAVCSLRGNITKALTVP